MSEKPLRHDEIRCTKVTPGYAHTEREGVCGRDVTVEDVKKMFYHSLFGGRDARVSNGQWRATTHDD